MSQEEKAKELVNTFAGTTCLIALPPDSIEAAQQCALICVDEIHDVLMSLDDGKVNILLSYFSDVRKTIENL